MNSNTRYIPHLNKNLHIFFKNALRISIQTPGQAIQFIKTLFWHSHAARIRKKWAKEGVHVPPIIIFSVTHRCNLNCAGCYAKALDRSTDDDLSTADLSRIVKESHDLGVSFFVIAGGEPFVREEIIDITSQYRDMIFMIFTNGILIDDTMIKQFKAQKNVIPVISLEGHAEQTDGRRGKGIYNQLKNTIQKLHAEKIFFAVSLTATRENIPVITEDNFIQELVDLGCKLFFYLEYTAVREGTEDWIPAEDQREMLTERVENFRKRYPALFISVPGDEEQFGGCISSGRGFVHISANGDLEPCPFAPFSDVNIRETSLKEALKSKLLATIRENVDMLEEGPGGCSLWQKRDWVESLVTQSKAEPVVINKMDT
ncbi:radical SAM protein [candidate division KSB1 bacterium]|nr:radical SAM protein [candidate division KSB1 bacterium]